MISLSVSVISQRAVCFFFFQAEDGIRDYKVTGVQTCALPICVGSPGKARVKIAVVGTGYVGLVAGACLAETGNDVLCVDVDAAKIEGLRQNRLPIHEPGLEPLVIRNQRDGRLEFTTDVGAAIERSDVIVIAVGTPPGEDGSADLQHVLDVARS